MLLELLVFAALVVLLVIAIGWLLKIIISDFLMMISNSTVKRAGLWSAAYFGY